jgi:hypothetical protein
VHDDGGSRMEWSGWRFAKFQEEANGILGSNLWRRREDRSILGDNKLEGE